MYDQELAYRVRPGIHYLATTDHQQELRTNALGTINFQEDFSQYEKLVFAIGDSFTQGTGLPADATFPFQLDLELNMQDGAYRPEYGVVNLGLAAYGLEQAMIVLDRYAERLGPPQYVVYFACGNDYVDDRLFLGGYRHQSLVDGSPRFGVMAEPLRWLTYELEIGKRAKLAYSRLGRRRAAPPGERSGPSPNVVAPQVERLDRLLARTRALGATLVVGFTDWEREEGVSYEWLQRWARRNRVPFADWRARAATVRRAIPDVPTINPHSGAHHRPWVNRVIAEAFGDAIRASAPAAARDRRGAADAGRGGR